jgi:multiple sugar transport system permease protein
MVGAAPWLRPLLLIRNIVVTILLLLLAISTVAPFVIMLSVSLQKNMVAIIFPMRLIPQPFTLDNYMTLFRQTQVLRWLLNSVYVTTIGTLSTVITSSLAAYAFARGEFIGKRVIFMMFLGILMVPESARIVPIYIILSKLGLVNTYWALVGPWFASAFGTFMLRQSYLGIPTDYDDAALIDGASTFRIYLSVLLPMIGPTIATLTIIRFMAQWNEFLYPMIITSKANMRTLTVGLGTVVRAGGPDAGLTMAGAAMGFLPTFIIFMIGQRYIIQGVALSGIKG